MNLSYKGLCVHSPVTAVGELSIGVRSFALIQSLTLGEVSFSDEHAS